MLVCVLDTDVIVAAFRSETGASRRILVAALDRQFELLISVPLMLEYESVLRRPEHLTASGANEEDVANVLDGLALVGKRVRFAFRWRPALPDPNDDLVLETAVNGHAHAIVTFNQRDFNPAARRFGCRVVRPGDFLGMLMDER